MPLLKRLLIAAPLAVIVTGGLFFLMRILTDAPAKRLRPTPVVEIDREELVLLPEQPPEDDFSGEVVYDIFWDGDIIPISRSVPLYPACGKGDGEVLLEFTVKPNGSVRDVKVISASSPCFARAARPKPLRWRYRPRVIDGMPVAAEHIRVTILFREGETMATVQP